MTQFRAPLDFTVTLHDEAGNRMGLAAFQRGRWTAPDEAHAEALRRAHVHGVTEAGVEDALPPPKAVTMRTPSKAKRQMHGAITGTHRRTEEDT